MTPDEHAIQRARVNGSLNSVHHPDVFARRKLLDDQESYRQALLRAQDRAARFRLHQRAEASNCHRCGRARSGDWCISCDGGMAA